MHMNYGRAYVEQQNSPKARHRRMAQKKFTISLTKTILILILAVAAAGIITFAYYVKQQVSSLPDISDVDISLSGQKSEVVDPRGDVIASFRPGGTDRVYLKASEIPADLKNAFVAIEDERFYRHNGVDLKSLIGSALSYLMSGGRDREKSDTITETLLKNNYFSTITEENTFSARLSRQIQTQYLALKLENTRSKSDILENYLNTINLGENCIGVEAASERYFEKRVPYLTLSEGAVIAAVAENPVEYDPVTHPYRNAAQRRRVLKAMLSQGYIDHAGYQMAMDDDVYKRISETGYDSGDDTESYFVDELRTQIMQDMMEKLGLSQTQAYMKLYTGGLTIHATLDTKLQKIVEQEVNDSDNYPGYAAKTQTAVTIIDQKTGRVRAMSGGRGKKDSHSLNHATAVTGQAGSVLGVLSAYAPAIDAGGMTLGTVVDDAPMKYQTGSLISNSDGRYRGFTTIREGIASSVNVVAVKTLTSIGTGLGYQYLKDFGISTLKEGDNNQTLALGVTGTGVKNIELAAAYAAIADGGVYHRPVYYTTVEDSSGKVILKSGYDSDRKVLRKTSAWLLTQALKDAVSSDKYAAGELEGISAAGRWNTADGNSDAYAAGYTPLYTCAVWSGFDDGSVLKNTAYTKRIWCHIMKRISEGKEQNGFSRPEGIVSRQICRKSGKLPEEGVCENDPRGDMVYTEYFTKDTVPDEYCDHHIKLSICRASGLPSGEFCPSADIVEKVFITGGSPQTEDGKYLMPAEDLQRTCDVHRSFSEALTKARSGNNR